MTDKLTAEFKCEILNLVRPFVSMDDACRIDREINRLRDEAARREAGETRECLAGKCHTSDTLGTCLPGACLFPDAPPPPADDLCARLDAYLCRLTKDKNLMDAERLITASKAAIEALRARVAEERTERVLRGKMLVRLRNHLIHVTDNLDDEGDRVYFGSTNDAETLKEQVAELDAFKWDLILSEGAEPDPLAQLRRLNEQLESEKLVGAMVRRNMDEQQARADAAEAREKALEGWVRYAAEIFRTYEAMHRRKGTDDGERKADANKEHADKLNQALAAGGGNG